MTKSTNKSFIQILWDRKVLQYLGTYFAVGFGLLQFVEFITKRYNLSGVIVDKYLLVWLALVPAIVTVIYFGGQLKFKSTNLKWPKVLVISNVFLAFLLGGFLFNGKAAMQSTNIELMDENGKILNAIVPKLNKVKTVANFQFENLTKDQDNDWYGIAFSQLLHFNLNQRPEFYTISAYSLNPFHDALGLPSFVTPNVGMQREIARKSRNDYFTNISYTINNGKFEFKGDLFNSRDGKAIIALSATDTDPYIAIDQLKQQIFDNIPGALQSEENQMNMPASTLITDNIEALKYHTQSRIIFYNDPTKLKETLELERKAVALDPTCAECHFYIGDVLYGLGRTDESITSIKQAIQYSKALPERMQFNTKSIFYRITNNMEAFYKLQELRRKMFPYEFESYQSLLTLYRADYGIDQAKALIQEAIDNGNIEKGLLTLFELQLENEEYIEALNTLERYTVEFPDRDQDQLKYATIYEKQGRLNDAKDVLLEEEALDPLNANIQIRLAVLDFKSLNFSLANKRINMGLQQAMTLSDSISFLWTKSYLLENSGQIKATLKIIDNYEKYAIKRTPINRVIAGTFTRKASMSQSIGKPERIEKLLSNITKYSPESEELYKCLMTANAIQKDYDIHSSNVNEYKLLCKNEYEKFGKGYGGYFDILVAYQAKDYDMCLELLENDNGKLKELIQDNYFLSNVYAKGGDLNKAKEIVKKEIDQKTDQPKYYYQMAELLKTDNPKAAKEYLDIALQYWANADLNYIPFQRANALSVSLGHYQEKIKL